jgi:NADPH:quinone reductase-like Zn-dependent oxidoreductase
MSKAILVRTYGGPEACCLEDLPTGAPELDQSRLHQTAIGVNFFGATANDQRRALLNI